MSIIASLFTRLLRPDLYAFQRTFGGPVRGFVIDPATGLAVPDVSPVKPRNTILYQGADVFAKLLGGQAEFRVSAMYFEFVKSVTVFSPTTINRDTANYYAALRFNAGATSDFLRVPLNNTPAWSSSNLTNFENNKVTFFAMTSGTVGERQLAGGNGFTFQTGDKVVGGALVATPTTDVADDAIVARFYFASPDQIAKVVGHQVGLEWPVQFN